MTDDLRAIAELLDDVVRGVPGVATLFAADPALVRSAKQLVSATGDAPLIQASRSGETLELVVSVGVHRDDQAPSTGAAIAAAVRSALPAGVDAEISVRISRVS